MQRGKEVVSDYMGLKDFPIGLVNSVLNFLNEKMKFLWESWFQAS